MIIYKCQNKLSGKVYIGQTIKKLDERKTAHLKSSKFAKSKFHKALKSYGIDAFDWEIIAIAATKKELDTLEVLFIEKYDSINNGYNMVAGGTGGYNQFAVDANKIIRTGKTYNEIYKSNQTIQQIIKLHQKNIIEHNKIYGFGKIDKELQLKYAKMGNVARTNSGYTHSDATKQKISNSNKGKIVTTEQRKKISEKTKEAMQNVDKELLGKKSVEARKPYWDKKHKEQKEKIIELKNKKIPIKKIIAELNISTPTYYKLWNDIKCNIYLKQL
jgi:group I intron endonuclease